MCYTGPIVVSVPGFPHQWRAILPELSAVPSSRPVRIQKASKLLRPGIPSRSEGLWADLGCGDGIFTAALFNLLRRNSEIYAVDRSQRALNALKRHFSKRYPEAVVHPVRADFTRTLTLPRLDGIVMANSLHFVREKAAIVAQTAALLKQGGRFIVVEYNTNRGNYAVPFPLDEGAFVRLATEAGLVQAEIVSRIPSTFLGEMYAGIAFTAKNPADFTKP
jgi:ubiquinone/menaquinone biosynthesis C-methylase UbiE